MALSMKRLLNVSHHFQGKFYGEDAGVLTLILLENVGLDGSPNTGEGFFLQICFFGIARFPPLIFFELIHLLSNGGVHEHGQHHGGRAVDGHGDRGVGCTEIKSAVEYFHIFQCTDTDTGVPDFSINIGADIGIVSIKGDGIKCRGEAFGRIGTGEQAKAPVGVGRPPLSGEHPGGVFIGPFQREHPGGVGEAAGNVLLPHPFKELTRIFILGDADLGDSGVAQRLRGEGHPYLLAPDMVDQLILGVSLFDPIPCINGF